MKRYDLVEKLKLNDISLFGDEFMLLDPQNLQKPSLDRLYANEIFQKWDTEEEDVQEEALPYGLLRWSKVSNNAIYKEKERVIWREIERFREV